MATCGNVSRFLEPMNIVTLILALFGLYHIRCDVPGNILLKILTYILSILRTCLAFVAMCMYGIGAIHALLSKPLSSHELIRLFLVAYTIRNFLVVCIFFYIFEKKSGRGFHEFVNGWEKVKQSAAYDKFFCIAFSCIMTLITVAIAICVNSLQGYSDYKFTATINLYFGYIDNMANSINVLKEYFLTSTFFLFLSDGITLMFPCTMCIILFREFQLFHKNLEKELKPYMFNGANRDSVQSSDDPIVTDDVIAADHSNNDVTPYNHDAEIIGNEKSSGLDEVSYFIQLGAFSLKDYTACS